MCKYLDEVATMIKTTPQIKALEELKAQLTQPQATPRSGDRNTKDGEASQPSIAERIHDPTQLTSPALAVLLEEEDQQSTTQDAIEIAGDNGAGSRNDEVALALEVINLVFRKLKSTKRNGLQGKQAAHPNSSILPPENLRQISQAIWAHWNAPSPTISYKIKNALKNLFEYINHSPLNLAQSSSVQFFLESVKQSILLEKRSLSILSYLLPHLSLEDALQAFQLFAAGPAQFLGTILNSIGDDKLASVIGQLAVHWTTKVEGWDSKTSQPIADSANLGSDWISTVFSVLFSSEERKRQYLCQYYLLPLFKTRPGCFTELAKKLSLISGPRFTKISIAKNALDHLSGIIALARLNPRQSGTRIQPPHQKDRNHFDPWLLPDDLLKVALSHPSVSLRSSALAIICQSTAPTSPLPLPHLDLILQFFLWNFGEVEAELKQNIFSNLNVLFNRLRDSSTSSHKKLAELIKKKSNLNQSNNQTCATETTANVPDATQLQIMINEAEVYLEAVKTFIEKLIKLCRSNLTISSPYRCQMASLTYLQLLLNTGLDPRYQPLTKSSTLSLSHIDQASLLKKPSSSFPFEIRVVDRTLFHKLILSLTSTYVDVREAAFNLLEKTGSPLDSPAEQGSQSVIRFMPFAVQCCNSSREAENSTAALLFRLVLKNSFIQNFDLPSFLLPRNYNRSETANPLAIFLMGRLEDLEDRVLQSELNLGKACEERPMAGSIMLMSELFKCLSKDMIGSLVASNDLIAIMDRTRKLLFRVWSSSAIVLCQSSDRQSDVVPDHEEARAFEFLSTEEDGEVLEDDADRNLGNRHKTILSACWRSMKEASALLMQTVKLSLTAEEQSVGDNRDTFLSYQDLKEIGELFEKWLLEIRHRGAFGAIHASYSALCDALCALPKQSTSSQLPFLWLQAHISAITSRKISTTRRSAGMPYCILSACQALSRSSPNQLRASLSTILSLAESQEISSEVQVHILNTLKILLTDGKVSAQFTSVLIERSYNLAIKTFVSPDWRVRNGALILFSGLTNRVFGTRSLTLDRSYVNLCKRESLSDFSRRLPTMPSILLQELRRSIEAGIHLVSTSHSHGPMFAVLTLLALLQNPDDAPTANEFIPLVRACLRSKVSKVRSIGADAMTGLLPCSQVPGLICDLLDQALKSHCHNEVHGLLLLINRLIQLPSALLGDQKSKIEVALARSGPKFIHSMTIPLVSQSTFLEILESLESRFMIKVDDHNCHFSPDMMTDKIQELRRIRAPALSSYETQATRNVLGKSQERETVLKLLEVGSTSTRVTVFQFLEKEENRKTLNEPEIIEAVFRIGRESTHPISVRLPALKLLTIGSDLKMTNWPVEELFNESNSTLAIPMRDTLLVLSACFFVNSLVDRNSKIESSYVCAWADKILGKIQRAAREDQSTETRLSAVQGLTEFMKVFSRDGVLSTRIKLRILELLITLIQDDDDEIRSSLITSLDQTQFFSRLDSQPNQEDQHSFQLELVPNLILEKLLHLAIGLNAFFGFKKLLNRDNFQADLDQLLQPPDDLFITERLNLYRDDLLEFELIHQITSDETLIEVGKLDDDQQPNERLGTEKKNSKKIDADFLDLGHLDPEIRTFKYLLTFLVPNSAKTLKGFELFKEDFFVNLLNHKPGPRGDDHDAHFNVISFKAWFSILLRLFNSIKILQQFPLNIRSRILASMADLPHEHHYHPALQAQALEIEHQFTVIQKFLTSYY